MSGSVPLASTSRLSRARQMATCCYPHCVACFDVVRYCPTCAASFAVCAAHQDTTLQCPWPTLSGSPCLTQVPVSIDQHCRRTPLTYGLMSPMYVRPSSHGTGQPPGLHCLTGTDHSARCRAEPPVNADVRDGTGAPPCPPGAKKNTASV